MQNDVFHIKENHIQAAEMVMNEISEKAEKKKFIIGIAGEVSSGKTTLAYLLGRMLKMKGHASKILDLVDFYKVPPLERRTYREKHGLDTIGVDEYDWKKIESTLKSFRNGDSVELPLVDMLTDEVDAIRTNFQNVQVLIISGLYAFYCKDVDFKIFMELTYRETYEAQKYTGKEVMDSFRQKILEKEHKAVQKQKNDADIYIDFNSFLSSYHL
ncbi:MAG: uridine kinase [Bacteroidetes bacterium]|nr:MAG: uridine kinase [Bacteroidota bacterium]